MKKVRDKITGVVYDYVEEKEILDGEYGVVVKRMLYGNTQYDPNTFGILTLPLSQCEIFEEKEDG